MLTSSSIISIPGIVGLTLAAVFAAAISSSLNSLSTALVSDFMLPLSGDSLSGERNAVGEVVDAGVSALLQIGIARRGYRMAPVKASSSEVLTIAAFTSGPMLGLYLIAVLVPSISEKPALGGFLFGLIVISFVDVRAEVLDRTCPKIWWPWYATIGSAATFASGWLLIRRRSRRA